MFLSEFLDKYAGSQWIKSAQVLDYDTLLQEADVARQMMSVLFFHYRALVVTEPNQGFFTFDLHQFKFFGFRPSTKKEVAFFTMFMVRYLFNEKVTVHCYLEWLDYFVEEFPIMKDTMKELKDEINQRLEHEYQSATS
jgi:hypothetical protein